MKRFASFFVAAAAGLAPALAFADPPTPPKVCVFVAGDPDEVARGAASTLEHALATRTDVRLLADEGARAAMRGDSSDLSFADLTSERRRLRGDDSDTLTLFTVGRRYGCSLAIEIAARPEGVWLRRYDVLHHAFVDDGRIEASMAPLVPSLAVLARRLASNSFHLAWGVSPLARTVVVVPVAPRVVASVAPPAASQVHTNSGPGIIGWVVAGGAAALLVGGFLIAQSVAPGAPVITVSHGVSAP